VVHSTTKFLNGHSDGVGGMVVLNNEDDAAWIAFVQNSAGAILSPFDSWLVLRGTKTLALRMEQHDKSGRAVAAFLEIIRRFSNLLSGVGFTQTARSGQTPTEGFGSHGLVRCGSLEAARTVLESVRVCTLAESLGAWNH
jgi:cystathionine gamma-lyase/cystathionine beta-lyase/cystathionine gamma-lyase/homocysteine desulfhydrase